VTKKYEIHPLGNLLPSMTVDEFNGLVDDIHRHGQIEPITIYEGKILEGRHRYKACKKLRVEPKTEPYKGTDPLAYVLSKNLHRRHLTKEQQREVTVQALKANPQKSNREIAKQVKQDHKTVAKVRKEEEHVGTIPTYKHPKARNTPNPPRPKPLPEVRLTASPEVSIEDRKAENAALDAENPLDQFKAACDVWLPKMTKDQVEAACDILLAALDKTREAASLPPAPCSDSNSANSLN
jgi:hypothetical protein